MAYAELGDFTLDGAVDGKIGVRWGESGTFGNVAGEDFITLAEGVDPASSLPTFVSDVNPGLEAEEGDGTLKWNEGSSEAQYLLTVVANDLMKFAGEGDPELTYSVFGKKNPAPVLSGTPVRAEGDEVGTYVISRGTLDVVGTDYRLVFVDGTFTIVESPLPPPPPPPPEPQWVVETYHPTPIAFKSIARVSDTEWELVVTNRKQYCNYRLIWTDDLTKGFVSTGTWEHAVGEAASPVWTTNVVTTGGAWFWRAEGADGTNMVLKVEE